MCVYCVKCTKFGKLFLRKIIKTVATRSLYFSSKRPKMRLAAGLRPDPVGELKRCPRPPNRKKEPTSKVRGRKGERSREGGGWKGGQGREDREGEGRGEEGREGFCRTNQNMAATALRCGDIQNISQCPKLAKIFTVYCRKLTR